MTKRANLAATLHDAGAKPAPIAVAMIAVMPGAAAAGTTVMLVTSLHDEHIETGSTPAE